VASQFLPVLIVLGIAVALPVAILGFAALVSQRAHHRPTMKRTTYESGVPLLDAAMKRVSVKFYLVALVFVVLDVEVAFLYPWAVTYRELLQEGSWVVLLDMLAFVALLAFAYVYLWFTGVFDWGRRSRPTGIGAGDRAS
jgi:NADH:ubiquinone oxidoreductase subunit 3 (subunit A)